MLFMVMHKLTKEIEEGGPPSARIIDEMGKLVGETIEQGKFINGAGLKRTAERVRLRWTDGKRELTRGPLRGENELLAGFVMMKVASMDEAIAWTTRMAEAEGTGNVEFDIGPVVERWDLGVMPKPPGPLPLNAMAVRKADKASESGAKPSAEAAARMEALFAEMKAAGVLIAAEGLKPSARGARLRTSGPKQTWTDGPFAESKEMISGFSIIRVDSIEEAERWTERYAAILGDIEVDVREVIED